MGSPANSLDITQSGLVRFDGISNFTGVTVTNYDVLIGAASNGITSVGPGTLGQILQSGGASGNPAYSTATYPASSGGTGKVLYDNGTNFVESIPTFPASASATSRKIIVSDGTNWNASTETYAVPGTSGNILTSDGTNWTSSAQTFLIKSISLNSAQIKALHGTPIEIIPTPGSGKGIVIINCASKFNYGGNNAFTAGAAQTVTLYFNNNTTSSAVVPCDNTTIVGTTTKFSSITSVTSITDKSAGILDNVNLAAWNPVATEITGNAANDNSIDIIVAYWIVTY